jgi:hypothetical protein
MTRLFLDVETYSPGPRPTYDDRIIAIAYKPEGGVKEMGACVL